MPEKNALNSMFAISGYFLLYVVEVVYQHLQMASNLGITPLQWMAMSANSL